MLKHLFLCRIPSCKYHFKNGKEAIFINGMFTTDIQSEIDELNSEVSLGHTHIYVDADKKEIDVDADPMQGLKDKLKAELLAELEAASVKTENENQNPIQAIKNMQLAMGTSVNVVNASESNSAPIKR